MKNLFLKSLNRFSLFILFCGGAGVIGAQPKLPFQIDAELRENAHAVIQDFRTIIEIESPSKAILKESVTVTVFKSDKKLSKLFTTFFTDDQYKIRTLNVTLFDARGAVVKKIRKNDFHDVAYFDGISVHTDNRVLTCNLQGLATPYTCIIESEMELKQLMALPAWKPVAIDHISLDQSSLTISHFDDMTINHQEQFVGEPEIVRINDQTKYTWKKENFLALKKAFKFDTPIALSIPKVSWTPNKFDFGGIQGGFGTWKEFGQWLYALGMESQDLPLEAINEVKKLVTPEMSKAEKTKVIYNFLQERSRYVSIQLGIGGWKPFAASTVHETQYGDCKALSNYTQALLKAVGVDSYYSLINAGRNNFSEVDPSFPSNAFNHAVVLVPFNDDTVLLECTSQQSPCGFRSEFTDDRYALAITKDGGRLIKTPKYSIEDNKQVDSVWMIIDSKGESSLLARSRVEGVKSDQYHYLNQPKKNQEQWIIDNVAYGQFNVINFEWKSNQSDGFNYSMELETELISNNFTDLSGQRIFMSAGIYSEFGAKAMPDSMQFSFRLNDSYQHRTHVTIKLPEHVKVESKLKTQRLEQKFGSYEINYQLLEASNQLVINRELIIHEGEYEKDEYLAYKAFKKMIHKIEHKNLVFLKQP